MLDGFETDRAAVNSHALIKRLNIKMPFSPTDGEVCHNQPLITTTYKGMLVRGKPRNQRDGEVDRGQHWISLRGSLIKVANSGLHNEDAKDPFELLYAIDDLATHLRLNVFRTPVNGLELSCTVKATHPERICSNIVSYLNHRPNIGTIDKGGYQLSYAEVAIGQHKLKIYEPVAGSLRVELKVDRMQFLGASRPNVLADLVQPAYAPQWAIKLLTAFNKIVWQCPDLDPDHLTATNRDLYLRGRHHSYWQVSQKNYATTTDFKRVEKQRSRDKHWYKELVRHHWSHEPPAEIEQRLRVYLDRYSSLMQTCIYQTLLDICLERWHYVGNLPEFERLPNRLKLPPLSEIYPLYLGKVPTSPNRPSYQPNQHHLWMQNHYGHQLSRMRKQVNAPGGMLYTPDCIKALLSAKTRIALALSDRSLF